MEPDEMQAVDKAEIVDRYRRLLADFWKTDSQFSAQTLATEEKKKSDTNSAKNEYDSTDRNLLHRKDSALDRIHAEESSVRNSAEEKRNRISDSAKTSKDALNEIAFSHFVNLSDDRNIQIESDIDLVRVLDGLVSKTQRSANKIKDEIEDYKKWKETHTQIVRGLVIAGALAIIVIVFLAKRESDIYKAYKSGKELYQQKVYVGDFGAIKKFEYLKNHNSIIEGDKYYQEISPLLRESYYMAAKFFMEQNEWEKFNASLNFLDYATRRELQNESNYRLGVHFMKMKDWSHGILYLNLVDKNYKSTAKLIQECNWRLKGGRTPSNSASLNKAPETQSSESSGTQSSDESYKAQTPQATPTQTKRMQFLGPQDKQMILQEPSIYSKLLGVLRKDDVFELLEKSSDGIWAKISLSDGITGWSLLYSAGSSIRIQEVK